MKGIATSVAFGLHGILNPSPLCTCILNLHPEQFYPREGITRHGCINIQSPRLGWRLDEYIPHVFHSSLLCLQFVKIARPLPCKFILLYERIMSTAIVTGATG